MWADPGQSQILLGFESQYGVTPGTPAAYKIPFDSIDLGVEDPPIEVDTLGDGEGNPQVPAFGNRDDKGSLTVPVELICIGHYLKLLLGPPTSTGPADPYTHIFKKSGTTPPSAYLDRGFTDIGRYYLHNGVMVDSFSISFGNNRPLSANLSLLASKETAGSSAVDATPTDVSTVVTRLGDQDLTVEEGGSSIVTLETANLTIANNLESAFGLGGAGVRTACRQKKMKISGNITGLFDGDSLLAKGRNHTESSLKFTLTNGTHSLTFFIPELKFSQKVPPVSGSAGLKLNLSFVGYYTDNADATAIKITLVNDQPGSVYA